MNIDIDELERLAKAVTHGPWKVQHPFAGHRGWEVADSTGLEQICAGVTKGRARYIAAANPAAVLELVREVRSLRAELAASQARAGALRKALEECLSWVDAWCDTSPETCFEVVEQEANNALLLPSDDTALRQAIKSAQEEMRERCAKACEDLVTPTRLGGNPGRAWITGTFDCAEAIRSLEVECLE